MKFNILRHSKKLQVYLDIFLLETIKKAEQFFIHVAFASEIIITVSVNPKKWVLSLQNMFYEPF